MGGHGSGRPRREAGPPSNINARLPEDLAAALAEDRRDGETMREQAIRLLRAGLAADEDTRRRAAERLRAAADALS